MMQLLLDFMPITPPPTLDNFVTGKNAALLSHLKQLKMLGSALDSDNAAQPSSARCVYLWGEPGCGRSHLLQAFEGQQFSNKTTSKELIWQAHQHIYAVDNVDKLSPKRQLSLFTLINEIRSHPHAILIMAGACAPLHLKVREDLRSRLGWGLVYQVHTLTDEEKQDALMQLAQERGLQLANDVLPWLMRHWRRDMTSLTALMEALDRYTLIRKKSSITLPLLKDWLNESRPI
jgi:DnaA-homolog protein